ncbi:hypothetical protein NC651_004388 [Populus alba x Populus x berolinensis]|nr:hypothetical protein NC651_004388 [Populus alba x Populus x berolinensis]
MTIQPSIESLHVEHSMRDCGMEGLQQLKQLNPNQMCPVLLLN